MRLLAAELMKIWTAPRTLLGVLLSEVAIVLVGALSTVHSAASGPVLPQSLERDLVSVLEHLLHEVVVDAPQIEKLRQVRGVPFALQIGFGNADVAAVEQPRCKTVIVKRHRRRRARLDAAQPQCAAVRQRDVERAASQPRAKAERQPDHFGKVRK